MSNRMLNEGTASKRRIRSPVSLNTVEDDIIHYKMQFKRGIPRGSKLNLLEAMKETNDQSEASSQNSKKESRKNVIEKCLDTSVISFKNPTRASDTVLQAPIEPESCFVDDSIMTFKNFTGAKQKNCEYSFSKKKDLDISLETSISNNIIVEPLSPKLKPRKSRTSPVDEAFDKPDPGGLTPVNVFHCVGQNYKLDLVKKGLSGMLGNLERL